MTDELRGEFLLKRADQRGEIGVRASGSLDLGCISVKTEGSVGWPNTMGGKWRARR